MARKFALAQHQERPKMILYPAIDLKDGNAVRLLRGDMDKSTVFNKDPATQAMEFVTQGCEWLHLVDLNGAFEGEPVNAGLVEAILAQVRRLPRRRTWTLFSRWWIKSH